MRVLFQHDDGGRLQNPALLDQLLTEKFWAEAEALRDEGWNCGSRSRPPSPTATAPVYAAWFLPETPADLWDTLTTFDSDSQAALFAHCASLTVNVVKEPWNRRPDAFAHGDQLTRAVGLDMAAAGWKPTVDNYLGRLPKARILEAVREAKGEHSAQLIDHLRAEMAKEAERLLDGTGGLPEPLRLASVEVAIDAPADEADTLPYFLAGDEDEAAATDSEETPSHAMAAE